ncbi:MAG TPA: MFS transporter [Acidimicrobiales bacterium]
MTDGRPSGWDPRRVTNDAPGLDDANVATWPAIYRLRQRLAGSTRVSNRWAVLVVVLSGLFTVSITITLLAVSLVDIADDLSTTPATLSWIITGPMLAFGVVGPAAGKAGDLYGHKRLFLVGLAGAGVFAMATAFAWDAGSLIAFRTLSATFGSATGPAAIAMINRLFDSDERVKALGFWSFVSAGAPVLGVVAGGPLVDAIGWRIIFLIQAPLCFGGMLVGLLLLPETERGSDRTFDWRGAVCLGGGVTLLLLALNRGTIWGWTNLAVMAGFVLAPALLALFVFVERRAVAPLMPLEWLRRRNIVAPIGAQSFANFAYMGGFILMPVLLEKGLGYSTAVVGLFIIARPLAFALAAPLAGIVTVRVGERVAGVFGAATVGTSMVCLSLIGAGTAGWFIAFALALSGIGLGISSPAMGATVANAVDEADLGVAGALQQLMTQVASVVGVTVLQSVQVGTEAASGLVGSYGNAFIVAAAVCGAGVACALFIEPTHRAELGAVAAGV